MKGGTWIGWMFVWGCATPLEDRDVPSEPPDIRASWFTVGEEPVELTYEVTADGTALFEGDIVLPEPGARGAGTRAFGSRWRQGVVFVENSGLFADSRVTDAIRTWEYETPLRFVFGATTGDRIRFERPADGACNSLVGRAGGVQVINLGDGCSTAATIHEIGHAVGLFHEHSRTDRDSFVSIDWGCIDPAYAYAFWIFDPNQGANIGAYDLHSVMHYSGSAFLNTAIPSCRNTITRINGDGVPTNNWLSDSDIAAVQAMYQQWSPRQPADYDGDGVDDIAVYRPNTGEWFIQESATLGLRYTGWGLSEDVPVPGDYDGDGRDDVAVWRPSNGVWYVQYASGVTLERQWGLFGDLAVPGDYDGDGRNDFAVFRPSEGRWYVLSDWTWWSQDWGMASDVPVQNDYDGDGVTDFAFYRRNEETWYVVDSSTGATHTRMWGFDSDVPVPGDYDADGRADYALWRPGDGSWYVSYATGWTSVTQWGLEADTPVPADYDGNGTIDPAVFRTAESAWYLLFPNRWTLALWGSTEDVAAQ